MHIPESTPQQEAQLSAFLTGQDNAMSLAECQGYLFAVICAPEPLDVHQWLEEVIPSIDGKLPEDILFSFMALYHKISEQVFETGFKLPYSLGSEPVNLNHWCKGFAKGATPYVEKLMRCLQLNTELKEALQSAFASLSFFALTVGQRSQIALQNQISHTNLSQQQYELMGDFSLGFAELIEIVTVESGLYEEDEGWD